MVINQITINININRNKSSENGEGSTLGGVGVYECHHFTDAAYSVSKLTDEYRKSSVGIAPLSAVQRGTSRGNNRPVFSRFSLFPGSCRLWCSAVWCFNIHALFRPTHACVRITACPQHLNSISIIEWKPSSLRKRAATKNKPRRLFDWGYHQVGLLFLWDKRVSYTKYRWFSWDMSPR